MFQPRLEDHYEIEEAKKNNKILGVLIVTGESVTCGIDKKNMFTMSTKTLNPDIFMEKVKKLNIDMLCIHMSSTPMNFCKYHELEKRIPIKRDLTIRSWDVQICSKCIDKNNHNKNKCSQCIYFNLPWLE